MCKSAPPHKTRSLSPYKSSLRERSTAAKDEAQAASTVKLEPPRSRRLAILPEITLAKIPANESSVSLGNRLSNDCGACPSHCLRDALKE